MSATRVLIPTLVLALAAPAWAQEEPAASDQPAEPEAAEPAEGEPAVPEAEPAEVVPVPAAAKPGMTLPKGKIEITGTVEINLSKDAVAKPLSVAPDVAYGVTPDLTLMLVHSFFLTNGFRGAAGRGLCVTGTDNGCAKVYDAVGVEGLYNLVRGPLALAANVGVHALSLDLGFYAAKIGAKFRYTAGKVVVLGSPSLFVGVTKRGDGNKESVWLPFLAGYKVSPAAMVALGFGLKGPSLSELSDTWRFALGPVATYKVNPKLGVGASFIFGALAAASAVPDPAKGANSRFLQVWASYTL